MATQVGVEIARILLLAEIEMQRQQKTAAASVDSEAQDAAATNTTQADGPGAHSVPAAGVSRQPSA